MSDFNRIADAIEYLNTHRRERPDLAATAAAVGLSPYHFQRTFRRWAGLSPKQYTQVLTLEHAKDLLERSQSVLETALETGLSGPGRLHDLFVSIDAVTPGEYKQAGPPALKYGVTGTPFGEALLAWTPRGLSHLEFLGEDASEAQILEGIRGIWPGAELKSSSTGAGRFSRRIFRREHPEPLTLHVRGTNFQVQVWKALLRVPPGAVLSYERMAALAGRPDAVRAVSGAIGKNPVGFLIPCHRVLRKSGALGGYRWGVVRKQAMLAWESLEQEALAAAVGDDP